jgi:hypothetical protein
MLRLLRDVAIVLGCIAVGAALGLAILYGLAVALAHALLS